MAFIILFCLLLSSSTFGHSLSERVNVTPGTAGMKIAGTMVTESVTPNDATKTVETLEQLEAEPKVEASSIEATLQETTPAPESTNFSLDTTVISKDSATVLPVKVDTPLTGEDRSHLKFYNDIAANKSDVKAIIDPVDSSDNESCWTGFSFNLNDRYVKERIMSVFLWLSIIGWIFWCYVGVKYEWELWTFFVPFYFIIVCVALVST